MTFCAGKNLSKSIKPLPVFGMQQAPFAFFQPISQVGRFILRFTLPLPLFHQRCAIPNHPLGPSGTRRARNVKNFRKFMSIDKLERTEPYPHPHHATNIERVCMSVCVFFFCSRSFFCVSLFAIVLRFAPCAKPYRHGHVTGNRGTRRGILRYPPTPKQDTLTSSIFRSGQ